MNIINRSLDLLFYIIVILIVILIIVQKNIVFYLKLRLKDVCFKTSEKSIFYM